MPYKNNLNKTASYWKNMAEREGFEPPIPLRVCRISSAVLSTTQPPLREMLDCCCQRGALDNRSSPPTQGPICGIFNPST